jgi:antitoxin component YwqK of YwqJK toxin-antitoxin module
MISYFISSALLMGLFLLLYKLLLEKEKMHRFNRFFLIAAVITGLSAPLVSFEITGNSEMAGDMLNLKDRVIKAPVQELEKAINPESRQLPTSNSPASTEELAPVQNVPLNWKPLFIGLYALISLVLLSRYALNFRRLLDQASKFSVGKWKSANLVLLEDDIPPYSFLNNIYLNKEAYESGDISDRILQHEITHIHQKHSLDLLFIEVLRALFWLNPAIHFYRSAIQLNHEFLADDAVMAQEPEQSDYQKELLMFAGSKSPDVVNTINYSLTKKRFEVMVKKSSKVIISIKGGFTLPVIALMILVSCVNIQDNNRQIVEINGESYFEVNDVGHLLKTDYDPILYLKFEKGFTRGKVETYSFVSDSIHGESFFYDNEGRLFTGEQRVVRLKNDSRNYAIRHFDSGRLIGHSVTDALWNVSQKIEYEYSKDDREVITRVYNSEGKLLLANSRINDGVKTTYTQLYQDGLPFFEYATLNNEDGAMHPIRYDGYMTKYDENGKIIAQELWKDGVLVETLK